MLGSHPDARSPGSVRDAGPEAGTPDQKPGRRTRSKGVAWTCPESCVVRVPELILRGAIR